MSEDQASICAWADETFGPAASNARVAARANEELAELLLAMATDQPHPKVAEEIADVTIVLFRLARNLGADLRASLPGVVIEVPDEDNAIALLATLANAELAQVLRALTADDRAPTCVSRVAGAVAMLRALSLRLGVDPDEAVERKMAVNRSRTWRRDHTGHGYHVRPGSEAAARAGEPGP